MLENNSNIKRPTVAVIIVNWNGGLGLRGCVGSIIEFGGAVVSKIVVVDNASTDGSIDGVSGLANVTVIRAESNLGFARACNLGARCVDSQYLLFLNPDAALHQNTLENTVGFMEESVNANIGICGVQLFDESGLVARSCARFPSARSLAAHAIGIDRIYPSLGHVMTEWDHSTSRYVDHVIGAFYLVRRELFRALNGFDERFFVYLEDLDFSLRARQAGWRSIYLTDVGAFHAGCGTSSQVKAHRLFFSLRSRFLYVFKHFPKAGAFLVALVTLLVEPIIRSLFVLSKRSFSSMKDTWEAYLMLVRWLPRWAFKGEVR
jgi:GT2 family glycosyltransferase